MVGVGVVELAASEELEGMLEELAVSEGVDARGCEVLATTMPAATPAAMPLAAKNKRSTRRQTLRRVNRTPQRVRPLAATALLGD